jgi:hypothetical protein
MSLAGRSATLAGQNAEELNGTSDIHSFIIRIWLEETEIKARRRLDWHGQITYVRNGERHYIRNLNEIPEFIRARLKL